MINYNCSRGQEGFTLVELMISLAMSGIIVAAVYSSYNLQQNVYFAQSQVVEMQQNIRAAMEMMTKDIRMAMYDPGKDAKAAIASASAVQLQVQMDLNDNGNYTDPDEDVTFQLNAGNLERNGSVIAENIQAIEFYYRAVDDKFSATTLPSATEMEDIQSVQVTLLAVAEQRDAKITNNLTYQTASGAIWGPYNDNLRRRMLTHTVSIRNQGL